MASIRRMVLALLAVGSVSACTARPVDHADQPSKEPATVVTSPTAAPATSSAVSSTRSHATHSATRTTPATHTSAKPSPTATPSPSATPIRPLSAAAKAEGLIDVRSIIPDAVIDMRYATAQNFTGVRLYPVDARCLVHQSMAPGLKTAAAQLRSQGLVLVFWDCYRPHSVQVRMYQVVPNPDWVAKPGQYATSHESGRSVDVTLARASTSYPCPADQRDYGHCMLDMGTGFDDFTPRAYAFATNGVSSLAQSDRATLRHAMNAGGLAGYDGEWWHFDGPGAFVDMPILTAPVD
jgi:zinc D-Ala-D-Ala dipeptidase